MGYGVIFSAEAEEDIERIASKYPVVASRILDEVEKLAADPVALSLRPGFPHLLMPKYQFWSDIDSGACQVTILFRYASNESDIVIQMIGILEIFDE